MAIDDALSGRFNAEIYQKELHTLKNRGFTDGYLVSRPFERKDTQNFNSTLEEGTHQVCAIALDGEFLMLNIKFLKIRLMKFWFQKIVKLKQLRTK